LSFKAEPVRNFSNQNKAWFAIEDALRAMITDNLTSEINSDDLIRKLLPQIRKIYEEIE
jgi:hypothetical protein